MLSSPFRVQTLESAREIIRVCYLVEAIPALQKELRVIHILCLITSLVTLNHNQRLKFQLEGDVLNV